MESTRKTQTHTLTIAASGTTSDALSCKEACGAVIIMPAAITGTNLAFHVSDTISGTYVPVYNSSNAAVTRTVAASRAYALPDEALSAAYVKLVMDAQAAARSIKVTTKS